MRKGYKAIIQLIGVTINTYGEVMYLVIKYVHEMRENKAQGNTAAAKVNRKHINEFVEKLHLRCPNPNCKCQGMMKFHSVYERGTDSYTKADLKLASDTLEIVRVQCKNCDATHALLPCDVIPYSTAAVDTVILTEVSRGKISKELEQSDVFAGKTVQGAECVDSDGNAVDIEGIRSKLVIDNGHVLIDGEPLRQDVLYKFTDSEGFKISLSTSYQWEKAIGDEDHHCFNYCVDVLRRLQFWNKAQSPSLGELCALLLTHPFNMIQEALITYHNCPFLFRLSRRTVSGFPYTGYASCTF